MRGQPGFFDIDDRLKRLSDLGDQLETFRSAVDFELFRADLNAVLSYTERPEGGRPPFDPVLMFKILVIQATNNLSDERAEFLINDRLSFMRFLGLGLEDRVPDARTIWLFREKLTTAGAIKGLFEQFDAMLRQAGYIAMRVRSSMPAWLRRRASAIRTTRRRHSNRAEYRRIGRPSRPSYGTRIATRAGRSNSARPNRARMAQCRQSIWQSRYLAIRTMSRSIAVSASFAAATDAAAYEGRRLRQGLLDKSNTASGVWADTA